MNVAVTGATGFVGRALCAALATRGHTVLPLVRTARGVFPTEVAVGDLGPDTDWSDALQGADCVVHCAARVHQMDDTETDPLAAARRVNVLGTRRLAEQAAEAGVTRLVFVSSIKVLGEHTEPGRPFLASDPAAPEDPYGISKWEAEQALAEVSVRTGLQVVVVRPPLVYGPGVKANFARLMQLVAKGVPLPLGRARNQRSLVALGNLVDLLAVCVDHADAPGHTFLVSDGQDLSTAELVRHMATAAGVSARLLPVPTRLFRAVGRLTGRSAAIDRLFGSLQVDITATRQTLGWAPPLTVEQGFAAVTR